MAFEMLFNNSAVTAVGKNVVVLSHGFSQHRLGDDPSVLGKTVTPDGANVTVIGSLPPGFRFPLELEMRTKGDARGRAKCDDSRGRRSAGAASHERPP